MNPTTDTDSRTRTEYGVELTWADGTTVVRRQDDRRLAESQAHFNCTDERLPAVTAKVVTRTVTTTNWTPVA